jgi:hypothetical protein
MDPTVVVSLMALVVGATVIGLIIRARSGRLVAESPVEETTDVLLAVPGAELTLVQLSSPVCSACGVMRRVSQEIVARDPQLAFRELDVTAHPELANAHNVLSTPTTLLVDASGGVHGRIVGAATLAAARRSVDSVRSTLGAPA